MSVLNSLIKLCIEAENATNIMAVSNVQLQIIQTMKILHQEVFKQLYEQHYKLQCLQQAIEIILIDRNERMTINKKFDLPEDVNEYANVIDDFEMLYGNADENNPPGLYINFWETGMVNREAVIKKVAKNRLKEKESASSDSTTDQRRLSMEISRSDFKTVKDKKEMKILGGFFIEQTYNGSCVTWRADGKGNPLDQTEQYNNSYVFVHTTGEEIKLPYKSNAARKYVIETYPTVQSFLVCDFNGTYEDFIKELKEGN